MLKLRWMTFVGDCIAHLEPYANVAQSVRRMIEHDTVGFAHYFPAS